MKHWKIYQKLKMEGGYILEKDTNPSSESLV